MGKSNEPENISRRNFGKTFGIGAPLIASTMSLSGCLGGGGGHHDEETPDTTPDAGTQPLTRAAFIATVSDYFDWVHSSEYNDEAKAVQKTFVDVIFGATPYAKQIETALEESLTSNALGYFYPDTLVTREDAADIYVKAFKIPTTTTNALSGFTDASTITVSKKSSVNAIVAAGFMGGASSTLFSPKGNLTGNDAEAILKAITSTMVTPVQVMPKDGTTAYRRYINFTTPTAGATIYYTVTTDGSEPADPTIASTQYKPQDGFLLAQGSSTSDYVKYRYKAIAIKDGMITSPVRSFTYYIYRPVNTPFQALLVHAATSTSPAVWNIYNPGDIYRPHVYYIEGTTRGVVLDAGEHAIAKHNLKTFVDGIATRPYDLVLGHSHPDHNVQIPAFLAAGVRMYVTEIEKAAVPSALISGYDGLISIIKDGDVLDLGNVQLNAYQTPGHTNGMIILQDKTNGWIFCSDFFGCNRPATADITQYCTNMKMDTFLSLVQQLKVKLKSGGGSISEVYNAHNEVPVGEICVDNFEKCVQQLIDEGDGVTIPSLRSIGTVGMYRQRTSKVGDMWKNKNWMAIWVSNSSWGAAVDYLSKPTTSYPCNVAIDYTADNGYKKYSVLSNIEIAGGALVGVDLHWGTVASGVACKLSNIFDPWTNAYTINVPMTTNSITIKPTAMSNKITSMKVNGTRVAQGSSISVSVVGGTKITVDIVAADGTTSSTYTFTVAKV